MYEFANCKKCSGCRLRARVGNILNDVDTVLLAEAQRVQVAPGWHDEFDRIHRKREDIRVHVWQHVIGKALCTTLTRTSSAAPGAGAGSAALQPCHP